MTQQSTHYGSPNAQELQIHIGRTLSDAKSELQICLSVVNIIDWVLDIFLGSTLQDLLHLLPHQDLKLFQINEDVSWKKAFAFTFASPNYYDIRFLSRYRRIANSRGTTQINPFDDIRDRFLDLLISPIKFIVDGLVSAVMVE